MKSLIYLYSLKAKGLIRRIYSKKSSAIITSLAIIFFLALIFLIQMGQESEGIVLPFELYSIAYIGFGLFMMIITMFQKRTALLNISDANFLLVGPYNKKAIFAYAMFGSAASSLLYGSITYFYIMIIFGAFIEVSILEYIFIFIAGLIYFFIFFALIDMIYVRFMTYKRQRLIRASILIGLVLVVLAFFIYFYISHNYSLADAALLFITSEMFNYSPIIGWLHMAIMSFHNGLYLWSLFGILLLILVAFIISYIAITTKDLDPEVIIQDATWYEEMLARKRETGGNLNLNLKVNKVKNVSFKSKANAVSSRLMLEMRKTRSFITRQEILLIILYFVIAYFAGYGFVGYSRYVSIILFVITMTANYLDELKHHYIYLIPDTSLNKLIALLKPTILKVAIVVLFMNTIGIIFKPTISEFIRALLETFGYGLVFVAANIWCIRLLRNNTNSVADQFIKMGVIILCLLPGILIALAFGFLTNMELYSYISAISSIIISCILLYFSKGIVSGLDIEGD